MERGAAGGAVAAQGAVVASMRVAALEVGGVAPVEMVDVDIAKTMGRDAWPASKSRFGSWDVENDLGMKTRFRTNL